MDGRIADALARLPDYLGSHVLVSVTALALGLAVSFPLALAALKRPALRGLLLGATSIVQTVPGLALLALFYPLLLAAAAFSERVLGVGFSALGFLPAVLALALYSMLPVVRNTITGILGVDPAAKQAALGVGMTPGQALRMVELPLALPVIMAGVRTAAVWVIGTATLSTPIGQESLGNYIFAGLQTQNWVFVLFGCAAAAALALAVDQLLALMERGYAARSRARMAAGAAGLALLVLAGLLPNALRAGAGYVIGAKSFSEQYILAALIEDRLRAKSLAARRTDGLGSAVILAALAAGDIDAYVDYTGTIWANHMKRSDVPPRAEVLREVGAWLEANRGIRMLGGLGFENAYALAMKRERALQLGIRSIGDLARHAPSMSVAADFEFFSRPEWKAVREAYGLSFARERQMQQEFIYQAAAAGEVDVISAYTSDGRIAQFDLVVLEDPKQAIPPYDAILLVSLRRAADPAFLEALRPLVGAIDVETMREANRRAGTGATPETVAGWLNERIGR
ncbi:MAG TPA: ABC transporter permease/substrate-binding protein [Hyphomicrobiaceae bacterium]|nr:ABC transporter permease/substrate-binding protein [Hyphomicrobiaceae bacterium]